MTVQVQDLVGTSAGLASGLRAAGFAGAVHLPGSDGYEHERQGIVPGFESWPAVVVVAHGRDDVRTAVQVARGYGVPLAVQATGHGTRVPADGGILLKTGAMAAVLVDPERQVAKVGPGARWGAVLDAAGQFGLAPLSGSSRDVGVTGYTLGGGVGWLARKYGFAADSVLRAEVVTADGRVVAASADEHPDLFWAIRGGSGNFGIVTSLEFRLYPVPTVYAGIVHYGTDRAAEILRRYREWTATIPNELSTAVVLTGSSVAVKVLYAGEAELAEHFLAPLFAVAGPRLSGELTTIAYGDAAMGGTPARHLDFADELTDDLVDELTGLGDATVEIRHWGGSMAHPGPNAGPVGHRDATYSVIIDRPVPQLHNTGRTFVNFLADPARTESAYTPADLRRLRETKRRYDPENFFHLNHNIRPA